MKVTGQQPSLSQEIKANQTRASDAGTDGLKGKGIDGEQSVKTTLLMDKIKDRIAAEPEVRSDRVAELKAQIHDGEYQVDAQRVAGKMLLDALEQGS